MPKAIELTVWRIVVFAALAAVGGCSASGSSGPTGGAPAVAELSALHSINALEAAVDPPIGWPRDKFEIDARHTHVVWISPSGDTAYGVVRMNLPLPVGPGLVLWGFLNQMRQSDRQADLLSSENAPDLPGLRFVAESGTYRIRANLTVRNWQAWAVYAGTIRSKPINSPELRLAEQARDRTQILTAAAAGTPSHHD